jgi:hypothetical protein
MMQKGSSPVIVALGVPFHSEEGKGTLRDNSRGRLAGRRQIRQVKDEIAIQQDNGIRAK